MLIYKNTTAPSNRNKHFYSRIVLNICSYYSYIYFYKIIINVVLVELIHNFCV